MGSTDFIIYLSVLLQIPMILVQLFSCLEADGIHDKVIMEMFRITMGCHQYLIFWELTLCKFQTDLMDFRRRDISARWKGLQTDKTVCRLFF